jgi:hypothetical protein
MGDEPGNGSVPPGPIVTLLRGRANRDTPADQFQAASEAAILRAMARNERQLELVAYACDRLASSQDRTEASLLRLGEAVAESSRAVVKLAEGHGDVWRAINRNTFAMAIGALFLGLALAGATYAAFRPASTHATEVAR